MTDAKTRGRRQLLMIAALFVLPLIVAMALNTPWFRLQPQATKNYGTLIQPVIPLLDLGFAEPGASEGKGLGRWTLLWLPAQDGDCEPVLDLLSRVRKAEGRAFDRIALSYSARCKASSLPKLTQITSATEQTLRTRLEKSGPGKSGLWLIDPLGNAMMYYPENFEASRMQRDLDRLLRYSKAGTA